VPYLATPLLLPHHLVTPKATGCSIARYCWHVARASHILPQHACATVGSHGYLPNSLRLHHQDGVSRRRGAITICCENEDLIAGQRDRTFPEYTNRAKSLVTLYRCPLFPRPPPSPPCLTIMSTSPIAWTTKREKRCDICGAWLSFVHRPTAYNS
jgi:hypothetical protein